MEKLWSLGPTKFLDEITAKFETGTDGEITLTYHWNAQWKLKNAELPDPQAQPLRENNLWKSTCFEAFIGVASSPQKYWEINLTPQKKWQVYAFEGRRSPFPPVPAKNFNILKFISEPGFLEAKFSTSLLQETKVNVGLTCVIESQEGEISYWALKHCSLTPDFHNPESFILERQMK